MAGVISPGAEAIEISSIGLLFMMTLRDQGGISLIHPYYKDEARLNLQLDIWKDWSPDVCKYVDITVIDDGTPGGFPLSDQIKALFHAKGIKFSLYKINVDLKWNTPGALNLGWMVAPKQWGLCMDTDCYFPSQEWERILDLKHPVNRMGLFPRKRYGNPDIEDLKNDRFLPCTILMHRNVFMNMGGFDEDFSGAKTGSWGYFDNEFTERASRKVLWSEKATCGIVYDGHTAEHPIPKIVAGEWMESVYGQQGVTHAALAANGNARYKNKLLFYDKLNGKVLQNRQILNFPWQQVYTNWFEEYNRV